MRVFPECLDWRARAHTRFAASASNESVSNICRLVWLVIIFKKALQKSLLLLKASCWWSLIDCYYLVCYITPDAAHLRRLILLLRIFYWFASRTRLRLYDVFPRLLRFHATKIYDYSACLILAFIILKGVSLIPLFSFLSLLTAVK